MRRFAFALTACSALICTIQTVSAADLPRAVVKAPVAVEPVWNWTGVYIGGHIGGGWAKSNWDYDNINIYSATAPGGPMSPGTNNFSMSGVVGGGQVGLNYQINQWVLGVEGTFSATGLKKTIANLNQFPPVASQAVTTEIQSLFTATARLGFLATPQWLLYIKGGYAGGEIETSGTTTPPFPGFVLDWSTSEWHNGWTVGVGTEYRVHKNITVGAGYDYIDLGSKQHVGGISGPSITAANQVVHTVPAEIHMVTGRVNFLFGWN